MTFPKIIWQTHNYKKQDLPNHLRFTANTWKNINPGWTYNYVDEVEREETVKKYPEIYQLYKTQPPIFQSDLWRFLITYEHGGCYADMDSICIMPLDYMIETIGGDPEMITVPENIGFHLIQQEIFLKASGNNHNYIVKAKSPLMHSVINNMVSTQDPKDVSKTSALKVFIDTVYPSPNVSKLFTAARHGASYKNIGYLPLGLELDYYGTKVKYLDYLKQNSLKL